MKDGKVNVVLDAYFGSSGKGKLATWLVAQAGGSRCVATAANYPNAGHTAVFDDGYTFVGKVLPTAACLWDKGRRYGGGAPGIVALTSGSGFTWERLIHEWLTAGRPPNVLIHERAMIVTSAHAAREQLGGQDSTTHLASTMQGSGAAYADKVLRRRDTTLAGRLLPCPSDVPLGHYPVTTLHEFEAAVRVVSGDEMRTALATEMMFGRPLLHEASQGYALSLDHGPSWPHVTSRNCTTAAALDNLGVSPRLLGDVYLNVRSFPIRVGNVSAVDGDGNVREVGNSGPFHDDSDELSWEQVGAQAGMPSAEIAALAERERTTVTKRVRRVATWSRLGLRDAARVNGATRLVLAFPQYLDWSDHQKRGTNLAALSDATRARIDAMEDLTGLPVVAVSTGARTDDMVINPNYF